MPADRIDAIARHVRAATDAHPHYTYFTEPDAYHYPSEEFEQKTGLKGIAKQYVMPEGKQPVDVFLPLFHLEVQTRVVEGYLQMMEQAGGGSPADIAAFDDRIQARMQAFRDEMAELRHNGSLEAMEELAVEGYQLRHAAQQSEGLRALAEATGGVSAEELKTVGKAVQAELEQAVGTCYKELERLNPDLEVLTPQIENHKQQWDVVNGVLSKFNIPDIKRYSIDGITGIQARKDPAWVKRQEQAENAAGMPTYWIPSPSTQHLIIAQAQQRDRQQNRGSAAMAR